MRFLSRKGLVVVAAGVAVLAAAGAAVAGSGLFGGSGDRDAIIQNAAKRLGVSPQKLEDALKGATIDQIDAAVADGRLSKEQGDALKERVQSGAGLGPPLFFGGRLRHLGRAAIDVVDSAAGYLGLTAAQLREKLASGQTLADVAKAQGKSVSGLEDAIVAGAKKTLDQAVADGRLTAAQRDELLARLRSSVDDLVHGAFPMRHGLPLLAPFAGAIDSAASYLGLTTAQLREKLAAGQSLADVAKAQGKSLDGLKQAIVDGAKAKLDQQVASGRLTAAQRDALLSRLRDQVDELVQRQWLAPGRGLPGFHGFDHGFRFHSFRAGGSAPTLPATTPQTF